VITDSRQEIEEIHHKRGAEGFVFEPLLNFPCPVAGSELPLPLPFFASKEASERGLPGG